MSRFNLTATVTAAFVGAVFAAQPALAAPACPEAGFTIVEPKASPQTRTVKLARGGTLQVHREALTRSADIVEVQWEDDYHPKVHVKFQPEAAARLEEATTNHDGLNLAFVADNDVLLSVKWQGPYGMGREGAQLSIRDRAAARRLFEGLQRCIKAR